MNSADIIGYIAIIIGLTAYYFKNKSTLLIITIISMLIMLIHLWMINEQTAFYLTIVGIVRTLFYLKTEENKKVLLLFIAIVIITGLITWESYYTILSIFGMLFGTYALWKKDTKSVRIFLVASGICWLPYALIINSIPIFISTLLSLISLFFAILILDKKTKNA